MLSRTTFVVVAGLAALTCACSPTTTSSPSPVLPLRALRLYETGVGYFERSGTVASSTVSLPVPAGHLDDALATLVVLDPGGKSAVHGIELASSMSRGMARALAGLPVDGDEPLGLQEMLVGLKGAAVEVRARGAAYRGRVVDVVVATEDGVTAKGAAARNEGDADASANARPRVKPAALTLLLITEDGAIVRVPASDLASVRPLDPTWARRMGSALDALSTQQGAQGERMLHVLARAGAAGAPITLGYVAETPVWRTTYRVVLDGARPSGVLQAWALLHNDTDEDWRGLRVELANGRPDSFLFPLAAPRYTRRALVTPEAQLATVPQLLGTTVDAIWGDQLGDSAGAAGIGLSGVGEGGGGSGYGYGHGVLGGSHASAVESSALLEVGNLASTAPAAGAEAGAQFVYALAEKVDLHAHGSALVPFAQLRVEAEPIAWVDAADLPARSGVRFVNSTSQTLPAGTIAFFADGGFAGESSIARLEPGERRFLTYGVDLEVDLRLVQRRMNDEPRRLVWSKGARSLTEHYLRTHDFTYALENRSGHPRSVVLAMALDRNATLAGPDRVDFDTASSRPLAVFAVGPRAKVQRTAHAVEGLARTTGFGELTASRMTELAASASLAAGDRATATEVAVRLREVEDDAKRTAQIKADLAEVEKDLERLREHMKALSGERPAGGGQGNQGNPFAARVLAGEDQLTALRKKLDTLAIDAKTRTDAAEGALAKLVP